MIFDNTIIVATQVLILFLMIGIGYIVRKIKLLDDNGLLQMTNVILFVATPCVIIKAFQTPYDPGLVFGLLISAISAIASHLLGVLMARLFFRKQPIAQSRVLQFSVVFSNCMFMCVPLLEAVLGPRGVFLGSVYFIVFNMAQWTYGLVLMAGHQKDVINIRSALINPGTITIVLALILYLTGIRLPAVPTTVINYLSALNTPLAMLIIGAQLAVIQFRSLFKNRQVYLAASLRLLIIPGLIMIFLHLLPISRELVLACLIPVAAPTATATALFATRYDQDINLATRTIAFTTLFSIITIPLLLAVSDLIG